MSKKGLKSVELREQLEASLPSAESQVVEAAITFVSDGDMEPLEAAVTNLVQIRSAVSAISKTVKKSKPAVATAEAV